MSLRKGRTGRVGAKWCEMCGPNGKAPTQKEESFPGGGRGAAGGGTGKRGGIMDPQHRVPFGERGAQNARNGGVEGLGGVVTHSALITLGGIRVPPGKS